MNVEHALHAVIKYDDDGSETIVEILRGTLEQCNEFRAALPIGRGTTHQCRPAITTALYVAPISEGN